MRPLSITTLPPAKKPSHLNQGRNLQPIKQFTQPKQSKTASKTNMWVDCDVRGKHGMDFFLWRKRYYWLWTRILARSDGFMLMMDLFLTNTQLHKTLIDGLEWCGLLVDYCDVFISCLDSHSDGTHSLQRIHCWASDIMLHFYKSVPMKNKLVWGQVKFQQMLIFGWAIPLNINKEVLHLLVTPGVYINIDI